MFVTNGARLRVEVVYWYEPSIWRHISTKARTARLWGSDALRLQLRDFMAPHLPQTIDLNFSGLPLHGGRTRSLIFRTWLKARQPAVFILMKHVANRMAPHELAQLREKAIAVGVDQKDNDLASAQLLPYDFHISSTETGRRAMEAILDEECRDGRKRPLVKILYQSFDRRLEQVQFAGTSHLSPVYLGDSRYAALPASLKDDISILEVSRRADMDRALGELGRFNFHYAVRPNPKASLRRMYKPFTKGTTAAACHSNILVNRQVDDAEVFLTPNYPYFVESNAPAQVEEVFRNAKEGFGGPEWNRGLDIMRSVRERVSGPAQAAQFLDIVTSAAERGQVATTITDATSDEVGSDAERHQREAAA
jgi:hypothetical protein